MNDDLSPAQVAMLRKELQEYRELYQAVQQELVSCKANERKLRAELQIENVNRAFGKVEVLQFMQEIIRTEDLSVDGLRKMREFAIRIDHICKDMREPVVD